MKISAILLILLGFFTNHLRGQNEACLAQLTLGISFPPVANTLQRAFTKTHLTTLGVTKIRISEHWDLREPIQGSFNWSPLDERIGWAYENNYEILLTIESNGPLWACSSVKNGNSCVFNDNTNFETYINTLLQRYDGKIAKIQFGNEWQTDYWYSGNAADYIAANNVLYNAVKMYSPSTQVVLGGFTTIFLRFLAGCSGTVSSFYDDNGVRYDSTFLIENCAKDTIQNVRNRIDSVLQLAQFDIIDLHFYDDVEQWDEYYSTFLGMVSKPIIVSEFGGPNMNYEHYSESYQANRLSKYIKKLDSLQIQEAYCFNLVEGTDNAAHSTSGLIADTTLLEKSAYYLFKSFNDCKTSIQNDVGASGLRICPNITSQSIIVTLSSQPINSDEIQIYSSLGVLAKTVAIDQPSQIIDLSEFSGGIYFIRQCNYPMQTLKFLKY